MSHRRLVQALVATAALATAPTADAGEFDIGVFGGRVFTGSNVQVGSAWLVMPRLGYYVAPRWQIEGELGIFQGDTRVDGVDPRVYDGLTPRLGLQYTLVDPSSKVRPFLEAGPGLWRQYVHKDTGSDTPADTGRANYVNPDTDFLLNAGPGIYLQVAPVLAIRTDLRYMMTLGSEEVIGEVERGDVYSNFEWTLGLSLTLGRDNPDVDTDGDGLLDSADACPSDPEDADGFADSDGCPDTDNDQDGIADAADSCPNDKEDMDGWEDTDGCPDPDNDGDTVPDVKDKCPDVAGPVDNYGCPYGDRDGDGVLDNVDDCPDEAGEAELNGCPRVIVRAEKVDILERVFFDTAKSSIKSESNSLLDEVASVLNAHPELLSIEVAGHTDSQGNDSFNLNLSQGRAEAVRTYLIKQGVDAGRLVAKGYGESKPIASNDTDDGRAENRRVEFVILEQQAAE
jgi:outer membrane protein OmpA-like peptidoglycan-associated protein